MNHILEILLSIINDPSQKGINYDIAKTILNNLDKIDDLGINELAELCFVSSATISRFCRFLGCNGFADFKEIITTPITFTNRTTPFINAIDNEKYLLSSIINELNCLINHIDQSKIDSLIKDIHLYKKVAILGRGNSGQFAKQLQYNLAFYKKITYTFINLYDQIDYIANADSDTLIIVISVSGNYFSPYRFDDSLRFKQERTKDTKAKIICITKNPKVKNLSIVDDIVRIGTLTKENYYNYSVQYLIDLICLKYSNYINNLLNG